MKFSMRVLAGVMLAVMLMVTSGFKGCGKNGADEPVLVTAYTASVRFSAVAESFGTTVLNRYNEGKIPLDTKDKVFARLKLFSKAGRAFHDAVTGLKERFQDGNVPAAELLKVETLFNEGIYGPFLDMVQMVTKLPDDQRAVIELAIETLKLVIGQIRSAFGTNAAKGVKAMAAVMRPERMAESYG